VVVNSELKPDLKRATDLEKLAGGRREVRDEAADARRVGIKRAIRRQVQVSVGGSRS
jgi:hypothetical protein